MKLSFKKVVGVILAVLMIASSMSAFACANDKFIGYDLKPDAYGKYWKIFKCPEEGIIKNGVAEKSEWVPAFYEAEYPHLRVDVLVLDGNDTGMIKYAEKWNEVDEKFENVYADVEIKDVPEFWEVKDPYFIYNRRYSDFTGSFKPTTVLKTDYVEAPVEKEWIYKGFDKYVIEDGKVYDYTYAYETSNNDYSASVIEKLHYDYINAITDAGLNYTDAFMKGEAFDAYAIFENAIPNMRWLKLTGPDYANGGSKVVVPFEDIVNGKPRAWYDDKVVAANQDTKDFAFLNVDYDGKCSAKIGWVTEGYELKAPYRYYQVLTVDGVKMNGDIVDLVGKKVEKEEVIDIFKDMPDKIKVIEKAKELVSKDVIGSEVAWEVTPFDVDSVYKYTTQKTWKVIDNPLLETVIGEYDIAANDPTRELRFVNVTLEDGKSKLPYIWKYTGECANPEIEWRVAFAEAAKPYEIYEEKWVKAMNGKFYPTGEYRTTGRYAEDMPTVSGGMGEHKVLTVMLKDTAKGSELAWALENAGYDYIIGGDRVNVIVPAVLYEGTDDFIVDLNSTLEDYADYVLEIVAPDVYVD